jgi:Na+:H+ antiporter
MMQASHILLLELFLMFAAAKLLGAVFERMRQPAVVGELLAGILLGPSLAGLVHPSELTEGLAEIGAIFLLFTIGLETKPADLVRVGRTAALVAILGVLVPFVFGFSYMRVTGHDSLNAIFLGAALVATSVGITARVLKDAGALATRAARVILAAAVLDDILGMILLAVVTSVSEGAVNYVALGAVAIEAAALCWFMIFIAPRLVRRLGRAVAQHGPSNAPRILAVTLCLGLSLASEYIGMAAIIGAFLAGLALADHSDEWSLGAAMHPIYEFLGPFFFVYLGAQIDAHTLVAPGMLSMLITVCVLAIGSKLAGCAIGAASLGFRDALRVSVGMVPRGEVGLIVASVGLSLHAVSGRVYTAVVLMSLVTTLVAPPFLRMALRRE